VLVVEDDPLTRRSIVRWLTSAGFEPIPVGDGVEALAVARAITDLSCVVSDLAMPRLDGDELRARLPSGTPLVMLSGDRQPLVALGERVRFVPKPLTREALLAAIAEVTAAARAVA
jgi:CheY-like chemotaxis protein